MWHPVLHIANGDATAHLLRAAGFGEALVWRDALLDGPARNALRTLDDWTHRARALAGWGIDPGLYLEGVRAFHMRLDEAKDEDEVVLWFEEDLFCQLPLCYLLDRRLAQSEPPFSIVCPEKPLGGSTTGRVDQLFHARETWSDARARLASSAWRAFGAPDPRALVALLGSDFHAWPLLRQAIRAHLARFPSAKNGLGADESALLDVLREHGELPFRELFARYNSGPVGPTYGAGDHQAAKWLYDLATCERPLVRIEGLRAGDFSRQTDAALAAWTLALTPTGEAVLEGREDHGRLNAPQRWLGGVQLVPGRPAWRWDDLTERLVGG